MAAIFISHSSVNATAASALKSWLSEQGLENVFLDLDKVGGLEVGENWEKRLYEEVARCHAVILVLTPEWLNSKWCFAEFSMARSLGKVILPILWEEGDLPAVGPELGSIQLEHWTEEGKKQLAERLNAVAFEIARGNRYSSDRPPYPGFLSFEEKDAAVFFGRDAEIREIAERLEARRVQGGARLLMVIGPSGSGKSSVVKAGVLPWLSKSKRRWIVVPPFRPSHVPMERLAKALAEATNTDSMWKNLCEILTKAPRAALDEITQILQVGPAREATLLITIDQFEEVFSLADKAERDSFLELLSVIESSSTPIMIIATVRSDLIGEILKLQEFTMPHEVFTLGKLPVDRLPQIIEGPAKVAAIQLEKGLTEQIIQDAISADALPLLAFALRELNERFGDDSRLTILEYQALGDATLNLSPLENSIRRKAEETVSTASPGEEETSALKEAFVSALVQVNERGVRLRRPARLDEIPDLARPIIQNLIEARLLSASSDDDGHIIEVAHEALFHAWPQLVKWLDEEQDFLIGRRNIDEAKQIWASAPDNEKDMALLSGLMLEKARKWTLDHPARLNEVREFVVESIRMDDKERTSMRRRRHVLTASMFIAAVVFGVLSVAISIQWRRAEVAAEQAEKQTLLAISNKLAAEAASAQAENRFVVVLGAVAAGLSLTEPRLALYLAGEAVARAGSEEPSHYARTAIIEARQQLSLGGPQLLGSPIPVGDALSIALSPNGKLMAVGDRDGALTLIDLETREPVREPVLAHSGGIEDLEFNASGKLLASAGSDGGVRLWQVEDSKIVSGEVLANFGDVAWSIGFDPGGTRLAASSETGMVQLWDLSTGIPIVTERINVNEDVLSVVFSRDGQALLGGTGKGAIHAWNISSSEPVFPTIENIHTSDIWEIKFSASGDRFATVSSDGSSSLFSYPDGKFIGSAFNSEDLIQSAVFSSSDDALIGGSENGKLYIQQNQSSEKLDRSAASHVGRIAEIAASEDGRYLASLGRDHEVRIWSLLGPVPLSKNMSVNAAAKGVAISNDGTIVAAADTTGMVYLWRGAETKPDTFSGHSGQVWALAISPDRTSLASADRSGEIRLWDTQTGAAAILSEATNNAVWWVGFTPDGSRLIAAGDLGVELFNIAGNSASMGFLPKAQPVSSAAISSDNSRLATTSADGTVAVIDLESGAVLSTFDIVDDIVWNVVFSPDGAQLAVAASDEVVSLWDISSGENIAKLGGHSGGATDLDYLSDGSTLAVSDRSGQLHFWDVSTRKRLAPPLEAHAGASWRLEASETGNSFVTAGDDGQVQIWDILDGSQACVLGAPAFDNQLRREYFGLTVGKLACAGGKR